MGVAVGESLGVAVVDMVEKDESENYQKGH